MIGPRMNISESAAHIAVSGIVSEIKNLTMINCPQATTVDVINPANNAPRTPPVALPNTPAVAAWKNNTIIVGTNTYPTVFPKTTNQINAPTNAPRNPKITAFGANGNTTGLSSAGFAPGTILVAIPLKAGTISPMNIRTPSNTTAIPAAKVRD